MCNGQAHVLQESTYNCSGIPASFCTCSASLWVACRRCCVCVWSRISADSDAAPNLLRPCPPPPAGLRSRPRSENREMWLISGLTYLRRRQVGRSARRGQSTISDGVWSERQSNLVIGCELGFPTPKSPSKIQKLSGGKIFKCHWKIQCHAEFYRLIWLDDQKQEHIFSEFAFFSVSENG